MLIVLIDNKFYSDRISILIISTNIKTIAKENTTSLLDRFTSSINSALDRSYVLDQWICDELIVKVQQTDYNHDFFNKS